MRIAAPVLAFLAVAVAAGCGGKTSSAREVFTPYDPASVEAAALKTGTCLALRIDGDPRKGKPTRTRCARQNVEESYVVRDFGLCPVEYDPREVSFDPRGPAYGVIMCRDEAAATGELHGLRVGLAQQFGARAGSPSCCTLVRNVIAYDGSLARRRAFARALRS
jgi:hypothetical protein